MMIILCCWRHHKFSEKAKRMKTHAKGAALFLLINGKKSHSVANTQSELTIPVLTKYLPINS